MSGRQLALVLGAAVLAGTAIGYLIGGISLGITMFWLLPNSLGLGLSFANLQAALADRARTLGQDAPTAALLQSTATAAVYLHLLLSVALACKVGLGLVGLLLPQPPNPNPTPSASAAGFLSVGLLFGSAIACIALSIIQHNWRKSALKALTPA